MEPLVSIIVPAWNCARWITATLESVYAQTYRNWEIILVDDGSTDDTRSILDRHMARIRYHYQENRGTAAARNAGLREARGELIAFLDNDDLWLPRKLELQVKALQAAPECGLVFTDGRVFTDDGSRLHSVLSRQLDPWIARCTTADGLTAKGWLFRELFLASEIASASSVLVSKQCIEGAGGFDEKIRLADDYDLWLRIALRHPVILVRTSLYMWRWRDDSQSGPINDRQYRWRKAAIAVVEKHLANAPSEIRAAVRVNLGRMYWLCARVLFGQDQFRESRRMFIGCLRHNNRWVSPWIFLLASYLSPGLIRTLRSIKHGARVSGPTALFRKSAPVSVVEDRDPEIRR